MKLKLIAAVVSLLVLAGVGWWLFGGEPRGQVGAVSTNFRWLGPNDRIAVDAFDDPKVDGVACHISRPQRRPVR
jgi:CreA protein